MVLAFSDLQKKIQTLEEEISQLGKDVLEAKSGKNTLQDIIKCMYTCVV